ncbi:DUF4221 family protein [Algoriphagus sp.]|uniref:DUF4221 family protein n=1 Tax=Algoriphagus sp. TaxID=1872435 RepID=UPI002604FD7F|nr:DUF4221 family protein [Algoriphagus sp.]
MKKFLFPSLFASLLFSCGDGGESVDSSSDNVLENFSFSVDTVVVDPGEEIINLSRGIRSSDIDEDKTHLYLFDPATTTLNKISLDELRLVEQIPFEKDGPNGVGEYLSAVKVLSGERFLFGSFRNTGIYSKSGEKIRDLTLKPEELDIEGLEEGIGFSLSNSMRLSPDESHILSLPGDFMEGTRQLAKINLEEKNGRLIQIPGLDKSTEYRILLQSDQAMSIFADPTHFQEFNGTYFLSAGATNSVYLYDYKTDSLDLRTFNFTVTPNGKEIPVQGKVSSPEEFESEMEKAMTQVMFEELLFDDQNERFYRFGRIMDPKIDEETPRTSDVFLFAFDQELNLIGETAIPELDAIPAEAFFKDGKLWSYVNVDDELGFAVFDFGSETTNSGRRNPSEKELKITND